MKTTDNLICLWHIYKAKIWRIPNNIIPWTWDYRPKSVRFGNKRQFYWLEVTQNINGGSETNFWRGGT